MIKISSITYVKDCANYIEQCLRSIMNQTLSDIEILVVDGGSTDSTLKILNCLSEKDKRIIVLHKEGSVGAQFNAALKIARGEYIAVCEGDDYILPEKFEKQYAVAKQNKLDVLRACYYQFFNYGGKEYRYLVRTGPSDDLYDKLIDNADQDDLFLAQGVNGFWNGLYSRNFLVDNEIWMNETNGAAYQDVSFSFLCQMKARRVWFMRDAFHCYRIDNANASVNSPKCIDLHIQEYAMLKDRLQLSNNWNSYKYMFIVWEIGSYDHFLCELPNSQKNSEAIKIYNELIGQCIDNNFDGIQMPFITRAILRSLYENKEMFIRTITRDNDLIDRMLSYFENELENEESIILFGIGHLGRIILDFMRLINKKVIIVDNNKTLQKEGVSGYKVYSPEKIVVSSSQKIIVANVQHFNEITQQLIGYGVDKKRIIIVNNEDLFLRKIFVKLGE